MIDPASTVAPPADPQHMRGTLVEHTGETVTIAFAGTEYQLLLRTDAMADSTVGDTCTGAITAQAMRIDPIKAGGGFIEPIMGRPRRIQGRIVKIDARKNAIVVKAGGVPITCVTNGMQRAEDFRVDQLVTMGVRNGTTFTPAD